MRILRTTLAIACIVFVAIMYLLWTALDSGAQAPLPCRGTDTFPLVVITTVTGYKLTLQNVPGATLRDWNAWRLVVAGGQTVVPYDNIVLIDARCA